MGDSVEGDKAGGHSVRLIELQERGEEGFRTPKKVQQAPGASPKVDSAAGTTRAELAQEWQQAETKVYVGNLGTGAGKGELERSFSYYGPLRTVWIARNPPGFAFVEFEDPRDAEDAVRGLDGKVICGSRVRVELSTGMPRRSRYDRPPARRPFDPNDRCYECGEKGHYAYDCHRYSRRRRSSCWLTAAAMPRDLHLIAVLRMFKSLYST
ncbi:SRSF7 factor, partial [Polypterus senegalus]